MTNITYIHTDYVPTPKATTDTLVKFLKASPIVDRLIEDGHFVAAVMILRDSLARQHGYARPTLKEAVDAVRQYENPLEPITVRQLREIAQELWRRGVFTDTPGQKIHAIKCLRVHARGLGYDARLKGCKDAIEAEFTFA